jgi:coenzyme PQQ synthesis protein D (PqqD)
MLSMPASPDHRPPTSGLKPSGPALPPQDLCPKRRLDLRARLIDGEAVILDRQAGLVHQLNPTASYVWERCDGHATVTDIAQQLAHAFDVDLTVATHDVRVLVRQLQDLHLLESG